MLCKQSYLPSNLGEPIRNEFLKDVVMPRLWLTLEMKTNTPRMGGYSPLEDVQSHGLQKGIQLHLSTYAKLMAGNEAFG